MKPEILEAQYKDGSTFKASDSFVRRWVRQEMNWAQRKATRAVQKVPEDWEDQIERSHIRKAYLIKEYDICSPLYVNSDQTQGVFAPGDKLTYAEIGAKQVSLVGAEEKRAFTIMVGVANDGTLALLPFQAIYEGLTKRSTPTSDSPHYDNVINAGMLLEFSGTQTYWSNLAMMKSYVNKILHPYFQGVRERLGLPPTQKALWQIDVWSVHRSKEFRDWMSENYSNIILDFVPGGCTGLTQPCDVGIQRPLKLSLKRSYHESEVTNEMLQQIDNNDPTLFFNTKVGKLRNASVTWLWNAYRAVNKPELVKKV
jgi:hypothetical protein